MTAAEWFKYYKRRPYPVPAGQAITLHSLSTQEVVAMLEAYKEYADLERFAVPLGLKPIYGPDGKTQIGEICAPIGE